MSFRFMAFGAASALGMLMCGAGVAHAGIYDISAQNVSGAAVALHQGRYHVSWIGVADGGAYNAANTNCSSADCTSGWTNSFILEDPFFAGAFKPGGDTVIDIFTVGAFGSTFGSALGSLNEYQTSSINHSGIEINDGVFGPLQCCNVIPHQPLELNISAHDAGTYHLVVTDTDGNYANNFGGVSLSITAVPEPATWALMLTSFGGLGAMMRSRRRRVAAFVQFERVG